MQYTENIAVFKASSEVIKFLTIGAPSSVNPHYNSHHLPNRGVVGHNIDRRRTIKSDLQQIIHFLCMWCFC